MCQQIVQFCSGSTKPLLLAGSLLTLLLAGAIGYTACNTNALYQDLDPQVATGNALSYHLQLLASLYLLLIAILGCFAAHYDEKHSIRALAVVCSVNFALAVVAILMLPSGQQVAPQFAKRLEEAEKLYDFSQAPKLRPEVKLANLKAGEAPKEAQTEPAAANSTLASTTAAPAKTKRQAGEAASGTGSPLDKDSATEIWDSLQKRGCCGFRNATSEWLAGKLPKSCCCEPVKSETNWYCAAPDPANNRPCVELIGAQSFQLLLVLALIALVNLYLSTVTGMSAFRTLHYNEASQNAYS